MNIVLYGDKMNKKGFTLVELSIVLVIIGIILGSILKGQEMIKNAKIKRLLRDTRGLEAMIWAYYDRKNKFPGDCNQNGIIGFNAPNNISGITPSDSIDPTIDDCSANPNEDNVNRAFSDLRLSRIAPYSLPNINLAKHVANGFFHIGYTTVNGVNYNAIFIYNIPAWMAKAIDTTIDGKENGLVGLVRRHDTQDGGAIWPSDENDNQLVSLEYYFDQEP